MVTLLNLTEFNLDVKTDLPCCLTKLLLYCDKRWNLGDNYIIIHLKSSSVTFLITLSDWVQNQI
jgi:hypothetical protein